MSIRKSISLQKNLLSYLIPNCHSWLPRYSDCKKTTRNFIKVIFYPYHSKMESDLFEPPQNLHGMKILNKEAFDKDITVLSVDVEDCKVLQLGKQLKKYLLKVYKVKHIRPTNKDNVKKLLFNPLLVKKLDDFDAPAKKLFEDLNLNEDRFTETTIHLSYDNYVLPSVLKAVLPLNEPPLTSFSIIGHIVHVNLKPHLLDYKKIIGEIIYDKVPNIKTVVNKTNKIENEYRNFEMELLCGEPDYIAIVKENCCTFKFDFSKVYWNPRLGTEHNRVIDSLKFNDALFDIFCGVGPFSIPAAKKKCRVYANDLNPESVKWLNENIKLNKISSDKIQTFNKDGCDFILNDVKMNLIRLWKDEFFNGKIVVVMNLPALALEFLKCFQDLLKSDINDLDVEVVKNNLPVVHCYFFVHNTDGITDLVKEKSGINLSNTEHSIHYVRTVSTNKFMYKIKLQLPLEYMISDLQSNQGFDSSFDEPKEKRVRPND